MSTEAVDRLILEFLTEGYREEIVSLLKYRRLARGLERLYGSKELSSILEDEERHARLLLDLAGEMKVDIGELSEQALIKELRDLAQAELKIAEEYEEVLRSGRVANERVSTKLRDMVKDSKRHHQMLTELSERLVNKAANSPKD